MYKAGWSSAPRRWRPSERAGCRCLRTRPPGPTPAGAHGVADDPGESCPDGGPGDELAELLWACDQGANRPEGDGGFRRAAPKEHRGEPDWIPVAGHSHWTGVR